MLLYFEFTSGISLSVSSFPQYPRFWKYVSIAKDKKNRVKKKRDIPDIFLCKGGKSGEKRGRIISVLGMLKGTLNLISFETAV